MMKKNIFYIMTSLLLVITSCDYNEVNFDGLDEKSKPTNVQNVEYTLTDEDYDDIGGDVAKYGNFSTSAPSADYLPSFFSEKYPTFDINSVINVTYDYNLGGLNYLNVLSNVIFYELTTSDYDSFGTSKGEPGYYNNFDSSTPPENYLPGFLAGKYPTATSGDLVLVTYVYYNGGATTINKYYEFNGTVWAVSENGVEIPEDVEVYTLSSDDYNSMGAPGKYDNFSSSAEPENYLPQFLSISFPYGQEGDKIATVYKYYSGSTETRAKEYTKKAGVWVEYESTIQKTDQYILVSSGWIFDPTVLHSMESSDYQSIVDYVGASVDESYLDSYKTAENYFGASAYYNEFRINDGYFDKNIFSTWQEAVSKAIQIAMLPAVFPNAVTQVEGVDVYYIISFDAYAGSMVTHTMKFKCTKSGPSPEFEYIEGSEALK